MCVVIDSAVWVSLGLAGLHLKALALGRRICSVDAVVEWELVSPSGEELRQAGLRVEEVDGSGVLQAVAWRAQNELLSQADALSLALAHQNGWRLATRDGPLEQLAKSVGVEVVDVVAVLHMMAEAGLLTVGDIKRFRKAMHDARRSYDSKRLKQLRRLIPPL